MSAQWKSSRTYSAPLARPAAAHRHIARPRQAAQDDVRAERPPARGASGSGGAECRTRARAAASGGVGSGWADADVDRWAPDAGCGGGVLLPPPVVDVVELQPAMQIEGRPGRIGGSAHAGRATSVPASAAVRRR